VRVTDALVPIPEPAARHVPAHPAEPDETELHGTAPLVVLHPLCHNQKSLGAQHLW
jgi:hypothetical protein